MDRIIKFRAWDEVSNSFYLPTRDELYITLVGTPCGITQKNADGSEIIDNLSYRLKLMQYTGLKDKNGVEIYGGDIVKTDYDTDLWLVVWNELNAGWWLRKKGLGALEWSMFKEREVIGNIYENPELVK